MARSDKRRKPGWNRRSFLGAGAVSASTLAAQTAAEHAMPGVLITSGLSPLARSLAGNLREKYRIRLTDRSTGSGGGELVPCALEQDEATRAVVRGMDAILHVAEPLEGEGDRERLDSLTRCTYNLLAAAAEQKAGRVVFLSTLELMTPYDASLTVSELWRPRPSVETGVLSKHLGEFVCREFARDRKVRVIVLRLGKVVRHGAAEGFDPLWVDERDVARAAVGALELLLHDNGSGTQDWWRVFHIAADSPRGRFSVAAAKEGLGYRPQFQW